MIISSPSVSMLKPTVARARFLGSTFYRSMGSYTVGDMAGSTYVAAGQKHVDSDTFFYDSLAPDILRVVEAENVSREDRVASPIQVFGGDQGISYYTGSVYSFTSSAGGITEWPNSFPFSSVYSDAPRMLSQQESVDGSQFTFSVAINDNYRFLWLDQNLRSTSSCTNLRSKHMNDFFFGFGEFMQIGSIERGLFPTAPFPAEYVNALSSYVAAFHPTVRGWKYGLLNGNLISPSCVFRKGKYGQFRDMLEQRPFSVFCSAKDPRPTDGPIHVRFVGKDTGGTYHEVDPTTTNSHNLSAFATSSLPYFDGECRDRAYTTQLALQADNYIITP